MILLSVWICVLLKCQNTMSPLLLIHLMTDIIKDTTLFIISIANNIVRVIMHLLIWFLLHISSKCCL
jgi:hypothetical protein